jgi:hypothetical protein
MSTKAEQNAERDQAVLDDMGWRMSYCSRSYCSCLCSILLLSHGEMSPTEMPHDLSESGGFFMDQSIPPEGVHSTPAGTLRQNVKFHHDLL